jgi:branched-chain amino acid transport system permease protein
MGFMIAFFDLILNHLVQSNIDVRRYLSLLSFESIKFFLLGLGATGILIHLGIFTLTGLLGSALAVIIRSKPETGGKQGIKIFLSKTQERITVMMPEAVRKYWKYLFYLVLVVFLCILPFRWGSYYNFVFGLVGLYVIAGIGLNIIVGLSGQLVLGIAAFFAMGAYSVALLNAPFPHGLMWGFWPSLLVGIIVAVISAILLGLPTMRLRGDYLAIVTLGFGEIIRILLKSDLLTSFTGGPRGIQNIKGPTLFGKPFTDVTYMYLIIIFMLVAIFLYRRLENSRTGRAWLAIKEDQIVAQATGVNVQNYKMLALCIGAAFAGLAGGIFAMRNQFTGPNDHTLMVSINILSLVIVGGVNSITGIILGAFALKGLPEILREIETYRLLVFGALLIFMMRVRPDGLWPASRPTLELKNSQETNKGSSPDKGDQDA